MQRSEYIKQNRVILFNGLNEDNYRYVDTDNNNVYVSVNNGIATISYLPDLGKNYTTVNFGDVTIQNIFKLPVLLKDGFFKNKGILYKSYKNVVAKWNQNYKPALLGVYDFLDVSRFNIVDKFDVLAPYVDGNPAIQNIPAKNLQAKTLVTDFKGVTSDGTLIVDEPITENKNLLTPLNIAIAGGVLFVAYKYLKK